MHNCFASEGPSLYEKDVAKVLSRWNLHPEYAIFMNSIFQDMLLKVAEFKAQQGEKLKEEPEFETTGRSRQESSQLLDDFMQHIKQQSRSFLDTKAPAIKA